MIDRVNKREKKIKILIVDDHPIIRQGLSLFLNQKDDFEICGEAENEERAMNVIDQQKPNFVITDITLKDSNGLDLIKKIQQKYANLPVLVLSVHDESVYAERALRAGAKGYIMKEELTEKVVEAIWHILSGKIYLSEKMSERMLQKFIGKNLSTENHSPLEILSDRELKVFELIGSGRSTHEIAITLHISPKTVQSYRARIKEKLGLESSSDLLQHAFMWMGVTH